MAKAKTKAPEVDEDLELEELDEDVEEEAPAKKGANEVTFGVQDLIKLIKRKTGKDYSPREVRTLLRKMARDGSGRVEREISPENRSRYNWTGPDDPEVKRVLKAVSGGEIEAQKKEALDKLKANKAAKDAAAKSVVKGKKGKAKAAPVEEVDDDDDIEDLDDDE